MDLDALIVRPGAGYWGLDEPRGPFDLAGYVDSYALDKRADQALLEETGFTRGAVRSWINRTANHVLVVFVFELADDAGAERAGAAFAEQARRVRHAIEEPVPGIDGARQITFTEKPKHGGALVHGVLLARGRYLFLVATHHANVSDPATAALGHARAQASVTVATD
jgi:hypothetical protein